MLTSRKRLVALAAAAAMALLLGGAMHALSSVPAAFAATPTTGAVGCANSSDPTQITFSIGVGGIINNQNQNTVPGTAPGTLSMAVPLGQVLCGVVFQDGDANPNQVDSGSITASVNAPAEISESNGTTYSWWCGSASTPNGCASAEPNKAGTLVNPWAANTFHVGLAPGASFGTIGTATPTITVSATWTGNLGSAPFPTYTTPMALIGIVAPSYTLTLSASPATIPAQIPASNAIAAGTVITATLSHAATNSVCVRISTGSTTTVCSSGANAPALIGANPSSSVAYVQGAESGTINFSTNLGNFFAAGPAPAGPTLSSTTAAVQSIAVRCGPIPNTPPTTLIPTTGLVTGLGTSSCQTVTATLVGGGASGTATVVANFIGDYTGTTAQSQTTVNLAPGPLTSSLTAGCSELVTPVVLAPGSNGAAVAALASNFTVQSIWVFNNALHGFQALYFPQNGAPTDVAAVGPGQSVFVCGTGSGAVRTG